MLFNLRSCCAVLAAASTLITPSNAVPHHRGGGRSRRPWATSAVGEPVSGSRPTNTPVPAVEVPETPAAATSAAAAAPVASAPAAAPPAAAPAAGSPSGLWIPAVGTTWQIVLSAPLQIDTTNPSVTPDVEVYDIDLFDNKPETITALHKINKKVICYFSAGTYEDWRPDASKFQSSDFGSDMADWPGEKWLNLKSDNVRTIMAARLQLAADKGCNAVDPDNVDAFNNENGIGMTQADSADFVKFLATEAHKRGMSIGLKNAGDIIPQVINDVDFQVNEECVKFNEGPVFEAFIKANKPVFHIEYPNGAPGAVSTSMVSTIANAPGTEKFSTLIKTLSLDGWVQFADGHTEATKTNY